MTSGVPQCNLPDGYWQVPAGKLVTATTWLEMHRRPPPLSLSPLRLEQVAAQNTPRLREVFDRIGTPSLWDKTIELNARGAAVTWGPESTLYFAYDEQARHVGLVELVRRGDESPRPGDTRAAIEIEYFGLFPELTGRGLGKRLMEATLEVAWSLLPGRLQVHTCHFDHPNSLPFYLACGFVPVACGFQIMEDPRLHGWLPRDTAKQVPLIERRVARERPVI